MFDRKVDNLGSMPEPQVTTLQRSSSQGGSIFPYAVASVALALLFGGLLLFQYFSLKTQVDQVTQLATQAESDYNALQPVAEDVQTVATIVKALQQADQQQVLYDKLLSALAKESLKVVAYKSINVDAEGQVTLAGEVDTYNTFAKVVKAFRQSEGEETGLSQQVNISQVTQAQINASLDGGDNKKVVTDFIINFKVDLGSFKPNPPVAASAPVTEEIPEPVVSEPAVIIDEPAPTPEPTQESTLIDAFEQSTTTNSPPSSSSL